ncbi:MAG: relaxase/mobilization nuclease domain-containing protein [Dysosmobacter welbionis]
MKPYKTITLRLDAAHYARLTETARTAGLKIEPMLRQLIMGVNLRPRPPDTYAALLRELNAIGNNVNQLAYQANARARPPRTRYGRRRGWSGRRSGWSGTRCNGLHQDFSHSQPPGQMRGLYPGPGKDLPGGRHRLCPGPGENGTDLFRDRRQLRPESVYADMMDTKRRWGKEGRKRKGYHIIQSFAPGEVTPDQAHAVGVEFARRLLGDRYEAVVSTHLNKAHLHSHIVFNSVSFVDGAMYRDQLKDYYGGDGVGIGGPQTPSAGNTGCPLLIQ